MNLPDGITLTERGWGGHFCCCDRCLFRRNTLVSLETLEGVQHIIVSTVGNLFLKPNDTEASIIGCYAVDPWKGRYYETLIFLGQLAEPSPYVEIVVNAPIYSYEGETAIGARTYADLPRDVDNQANIMHDRAVQWVVDNFNSAYTEGLLNRRENEQ